MSQIFDVIAKSVGPVTIASQWAGQRISVTRLCYRGPNRFIVPTFQGNPPGIEFYSDGARIIKGASLRTDVSHELASFKLNHVGENTIAMHAVVRKFTEVNTLGIRTEGNAVLVPHEMVKINNATYYFKAKGMCAKQDLITLHSDDGAIIEFSGDIEMYSNEPKSLRLHVKVPGNAKVEMSYAQILKEKDSIMAKLTRMQYGKHTLQPQSL